MSGRSTADIVTDLSDLATVARQRPDSEVAIFYQDAADRLAELDNQAGMLLFEVKGHQADAMAIDALRPPCPTCGGKGTVWDTTTTIEDFARCPDCVDGKVSIEQLAATYNAVWSDYVTFTGLTRANLVMHLRTVKP